MKRVDIVRVDLQIAPEEDVMTQTTEDSYHYGVIARAIREIDASERGLALDELARRMNMSASHFQRVFSQWAGISPRRYHQYLALGHARALLRDSGTMFEAAAGAGLSGPGRLHDLLVRWEAMTPGEYAERGRGLTIRSGWFDSPFGEMLAMGTERGLCGLAFSAECGREHAYRDMVARWPRAEFVEDPEPLSEWVSAALGQKGEARLLLLGAPFQIKVWEALMAIPSGMVTTYSELAEMAGVPRAVRATGTAVGRNPVSWLIPCHRVLRKSGGLGGYHWGLNVKRSLLGWESARRDAAGNGANMAVDAAASGP